MTVTTAPARLRAAPDARPPCQVWQPRLLEPPTQPTLLSDPEPASYEPRPTRGRPVSGPRRSGSPGELPDVRAWAARLASAIMQVVQGLRPIAQLTRWVDERALAEIALCRRQGASAGVRTGRPAAVRSVRLQSPVPSVAEVCAHLSVGSRSVALAFRLERWGDRWLCTALELGLPAEQQPGLAGS